MYTYSINPASIIDEAIDLSTRLSGTAFPISIFPAKIQRIIREVHECHNYPTDYIAAAILTAIAVGIGNTHLAQIKQGWMESPILYIKTNVDYACGQMNYPLGSRTSTAITTVRRNSFGSPCSVPRPPCPTARMPRVPSSSSVRTYRSLVLSKRKS